MTLIQVASTQQWFKLCKQNEKSFSVMSYNILLPNLVDGWWIRKNYAPDVDEIYRDWSHRHKLLRKQLLEVRPTIICLQEASAASFEEDFLFLKEAGYKHVLHRKFRFRTATFWQQDQFDLEVVHHKDKVLVILLKSKCANSNRLIILNCHLAGGPDPRRRLRQVFQGLDQARKQVAKFDLEPVSTPAIVCGDFNTYPGESGVKNLLVNERVEANFREANYPLLEVTSRIKSQSFGRFADLWEETYGAKNHPATLIVPSIDELLWDYSADKLTVECEKSLKDMFLEFTDGASLMDKKAIERWLTTINGAYRGSELQDALSIMEEKGAEELSLDDFLFIYLKNLQEGKSWSVHHDMHTCGVGLSPKSSCGYCIDYLYHNSNIEALAVKKEVPFKHMEKIALEHACPNIYHPSDHLPILALFRFVSK